MAKSKTVEATPSVAAFNPAAFKPHADKPPLRIDLTVPFADGIYNFLLGVQQMNELQNLSGGIDRDGSRTPLGIFALYGRVSRGRLMKQTGPGWQNLHLSDTLASEAREDDIRNVIRLGLVGGKGGKVDAPDFVKVTPARAKQLVDAYVVGQPLEDNWTLAFAILGSRICGRVPDPEVDPE